LFEVILRTSLAAHPVGTMLKLLPSTFNTSRSTASALGYAISTSAPFTFGITKPIFLAVST